MNECKGKIKAILPFGLIIQILDDEGKRIIGEGFLFEKDITKNFVPDLNLHFKIGETINISKIENSNGPRQNYSYINSANRSFDLLHEEDPLFKALKNQLNKN